MTPNTDSNISVEFISECLKLSALAECVLMIGLPARLNTRGPACVVKAFDELAVIKGQCKELSELNPLMEQRYKDQLNEIVRSTAARIHPEIVSMFKGREERAKARAEKASKKHRH